MPEYYLEKNYNYICEISYTFRLYLGLKDSRLYVYPLHRERTTELCKHEF